MRKMSLWVALSVAMALGAVPFLVHHPEFSTGVSTVAEAQAYPGSQASLLPNYSYAAEVFTANSTTGATINTGGLASGTIIAFGTGLTTATWQIQGSNDGGTHWTNLVTVAYPTTTLPITTVANSQTTTATTLYLVNLAGFTNVRFATTSGTFTATSFSLKLTASSNHGLL